MKFWCSIQLRFIIPPKKIKYFCRTFCFEINIAQILSLFAKPFYHSWFPCLIEFYSLLSFPSFCKDRFIASEIGMMHQASSWKVVLAHVHDCPAYLALWEPTKSSILFAPNPISLWGLKFFGNSFIFCF